MSIKSKLFEIRNSYIGEFDERQQVIRAKCNRDAFILVMLLLFVDGIISRRVGNWAPAGMQQIIVWAFVMLVRRIELYACGAANRTIHFPGKGLMMFLAVLIVVGVIAIVFFTSQDIEHYKNAEKVFFADGSLTDFGSFIVFEILMDILIIVPLLAAPFIIHREKRDGIG